MGTVQHSLSFANTSNVGTLPENGVALRLSRTSSAQTRYSTSCFASVLVRPELMAPRLIGQSIDPFLRILRGMKDRIDVNGPRLNAIEDHVWELLDNRSAHVVSN